MLEAARSCVGFFCPACGAGLRAPRADAGTAIDCSRCGELVRVPRQPHPVESEADPLPLISPADSDRAVTGLRLLRLSLGLFVLQYALTAAAVGYWASVEGPAHVLARDPGSVRGLLVAVWAIDLVLTTGRAVLRWIGYLCCGPAAAAVRAGGAVAWARFGVLLRGVGYALAAVPWVLGGPAATPAVVEAVADIGLVACCLGAALEFGVLAAWYRVLAEVSGRESARSVARYAGTFVTAGLVTAASVLLAGTVVVIALVQQNGQPGPVRRPARLNYEALPPEAWYALLALATLVAGFGLVLCWQYSRILVALRSGLAGPTGR
jgi:hypothetical protein